MKYRIGNWLNGYREFTASSPQAAWTKGTAMLSPSEKPPGKRGRFVYLEEYSQNNPPFITQSVLDHDNLPEDAPGRYASHILPIKTGWKMVAAGFANDPKLIPCPTIERVYVQTDKGDLQEFFYLAR